MRIKKIEINHGLCIGCGVCQSLCPKAFEVKNGKSHLKPNWQEASEEDLIRAAHSCPMGAITLYDKDGKKIE